MKKEDTRVACITCKLYLDDGVCRWLGKSTLANRLRYCSHHRRNRKKRRMDDSAYCLETYRVPELQEQKEAI